MVSEESAEKIIDKIFALSKADQTEVLFQGTNSALTRYANNHVHQNLAESSNFFSVRVLVGKKSGKISTNLYDDNSLENKLDLATQFAKTQKDDPNYVPLVGKQQYTPMNLFFQSTASCSPDRRAEGVEKITRPSQQRKLNSAGAFSVDEELLIYATSAGAYASALSTLANFNAMVMTENSSGWASEMNRDVDKIVPFDLGKIAQEKAEKGRKPKDLEPGKYTVILEPLAVSTMLNDLGYGFSASAYQEKRSFLNEALGKKICGENITLVDDPFHPEVIALPFDLQGMPKKRVVLIEKGVAKSVVHDLVTASQSQTESTGHGNPLPDPWGPYPQNLLLESGESTLEEMIGSTKKGVLVTRFHYTGMIDPMKTLETGMTRDGTFWIENGRIAYPVKNLRFTQSILDALSKVELISRERKSVRGALVPALKITEFEFSSSTLF